MHRVNAKVNDLCIKNEGANGWISLKEIGICKNP